VTSDEPTIVADNARCGVWVGATFISGFVDDSACGRCGTSRIYDDHHDAYLCPRCNVWLEEGCADALCSFCANRPAMPLPRSGLASR
jgi:ribosomal protein S27AE